MKNTFFIPIVFLVQFCIWFVIGILFFSFTGDALYALAFKNIYPLFSNIQESLFFACFLGLILAVLNTFFYMMRHKTLVFLALFFIAILYFCGLLLGLPFLYKHTPNSKNFSLIQRQNLSYYSVEPKKIEHDDMGRRFVWLDKNKEGSKFYAVNIVDDTQFKTPPRVDFYPEIDLASPDAVFPAPNEVLSSTITIPNFLKTFYYELDRMHKDIGDSLQKGLFSYYVLIIPFALAVFLLIGFCFFSSWRMLNLLFCLLLMRFLFFLWPQISMFLLFPSILERFAVIIGYQRVLPATYAGICGLFFIINIFVLFRRLLLKKATV